MSRDLARDWMWSEACEMLARAERLHREFFRPAIGAARQPAWEPPVEQSNDAPVRQLARAQG